MTKPDFIGSHSRRPFRYGNAVRISEFTERTMFTGIIEEIGRIRRAESLGGGRRFTIEASFAGTLRPDQSVAVNGCCQTVVDIGDGAFSVVAIEETLSKTTFGSLGEDAPVNLERAMRPDTRLDGHIVQGHVDATGELVEVKELEASRLYRVAFEAEFAPYVIPVGSVAIDGISLTVARLGGRRGDGRHELTVAIIPHTYEMTIVPTWSLGSQVNLEFDLIGKYVARYMEVAGRGM